MSATPVTQEVLDGVRLLETEFKRNAIVGTGGRRAPWEQRARLVSLVVGEVENNRAEISRLTARIAELEQRLKPFAEVWDVACRDQHAMRHLTLDELCELAVRDVSCIHFQNARTTLEASERGNES